LLQNCGTIFRLSLVKSSCSDDIYKCALKSKFLPSQLQVVVDVYLFLLRSANLLCALNTFYHYKSLTEKQMANFMYFFLQYFNAVGLVAYNMTMIIHS